MKIISELIICTNCNYSCMRTVRKDVASDDIPCNKCGGLVKVIARTK